MFKFVHTADLHLDSPLKTLALRDPELRDLVGTATRSALTRIVDLCIEEKVDALLIAGDLYDGNIRGMKTAVFLVDEMERLIHTGVKVFVIRGNHDAESVLSRELGFPTNVHVFNHHGETIELREKNVAIHGVSFSKPQAPESLLPKYNEPVRGAFNIGMLHTSLSGAAGHDPYSPCSVGDLRAHGYDYWALGHVHTRKVHCMNPCVVMPGMPQGRDIGESGSKSVTLVTVNNGEISLEEHETCAVDFSRRNILLGDVEDWRGALDCIDREIARAAAERSDHMVLRIVLKGGTPLAWRLRRDHDLLFEQVKQCSKRHTHVWIEKIVNTLTPPPDETEGEDPRRELVCLMEALVSDSSFMSGASDYVENLVRELPAELRGDFGDNDAERTDAVRQLLKTGINEIAARMMSGQANDAS